MDYTCYNKYYDVPTYNNLCHNNKCYDIVFLGANITNLYAALSLCQHHEQIKLLIIHPTEEIYNETVISPITGKCFSLLNNLDSSLPSAVMDRCISTAPTIVTKTSETKMTTKKISSMDNKIKLKDLTQILVSYLLPCKISFNTTILDVDETLDTIILTLNNGKRIETRLCIDGANGISMEKLSSTVYQNINYAKAYIVIDNIQSILDIQDSQFWKNDEMIISSNKLKDSVLISLIFSILDDSDVQLSNIIKKLEEFPDLKKMMEKHRVNLISSEVMRCPMEGLSFGRLITSWDLSSCIPEMSHLYLTLAIEEAINISNSISEKGLTQAALKAYQLIKFKNTAFNVPKTREEIINNNWMDKWNIIEEDEIEDDYIYKDELNENSKIKNKEFQKFISKGLISGNTLSWNITI